MNRAGRKLKAEETLRICEVGYYDLPDGVRVDVTERISDAVKNSKVFSVSKLDALRRDAPVDVDKERRTVVEVTPECAISACSRLFSEEKASTGVAEPKIGCLNFASAKNVCGGMRGGSLAQEESLGLCSGLYPTLSQFQTDYYELNKANDGGGLYTDTAMVSPAVPVFRTSPDLNLVPDADVFPVDFVTCPAPNRGRMVGAQKRKCGSTEAVESEAKEAMLRRINNVLCLFSSVLGVETLLLGAWGCGVFGNEAEDVAGYFAQQLIAPGATFESAFKKVVFAVAKDQKKVDVFRAVFEKAK